MIKRMNLSETSWISFQTFHIRHRPGDHLELRVGVHTGDDDLDHNVDQDFDHNVDHNVVHGETDDDAIDRTMPYGCDLFLIFFLTSSSSYIFKNLFDIIGRSMLCGCGGCEDASLLPFWGHRQHRFQAWNIWPALVSSLPSFSLSLSSSLQYKTSLFEAWNIWPASGAYF